MAMLGSLCNTQISISRIQQRSSIPRRFPSESSILMRSFVEIGRNSICGPSTFLSAFTGKRECKSSFSSSVELPEDDAPASSIVFVKGLAQSSSESAVKDLFSQIGEVSRVKLILDKVTKKRLGFAYVWFTREKYAQGAVEEMNGKFFEGRFINVMIARSGSCRPRAKATPYKF